jgi:hypothetical protein
MTVVDLARYDDFVATSRQGTLFCMSWWLEAVAPGAHEILTVQRGGQIEAAWPIVFGRSRLAGPIIAMPHLTPWLGILHGPLRSTTQPRELSARRQIVSELISQLPPVAALDVNFHRSFDYWLPFYWQGFSQTTRYTYVLSPILDHEALWQGLGKNIRSDIRKAERQGVRVQAVENLSDFWELHAKTFARQSLAAPYDLAFLRRVDLALSARARRRILLATDESGYPHAGAYLAWDHRAAYYLVGGGDPERRHSGASSLVLWEAIKFASTISETFDFEGSMLEPVEHFFSAFGGRPYPYSRIGKTVSRRLKIRDMLRGILGEKGHVSRSKKAD